MGLNMRRKILDYGSWLKAHPNVRSLRGREIGKTKWAASMLYVSLPCSKCGEGRWVSLRAILTGRRRSSLCRRCWARNDGTKGAANPNWRGGRFVGSQGYVMCYVSAASPYFSMGKQLTSAIGAYIPEHRLVMAQHLGRCLNPWEIVHHKNGVRTDNGLDNLEIIMGCKLHHSYNLLQKELKRLGRENAALRERLAQYE